MSDIPRLTSAVRELWRIWRAAILHSQTAPSRLVLGRTMVIPACHRCRAENRVLLRARAPCPDRRRSRAHE